MEQYLAQLIEDIHKAISNIRPPYKIGELSEANPDDELESEDMSYAEKFPHRTKKSISKITGIDFKRLPPVQNLISGQQALLTTELEKLLQMFHFRLNFPENYPANLRYPFILKFWKEKHVPLSFGDNHIELCDMNEDECPFLGYCTICEEVATQMKFDDKHSPSPFNEEKEEDEDEYFEEIDGFYDDDGNKINLSAIPIPGLCILCKKYQINDWDENLLCLMNRREQRNETDFICGVFDKL